MVVPAVVAEIVVELPIGMNDGCYHPTGGQFLQVPVDRGEPHPAETEFELEPDFLGARIPPLTGEDVENGPPLGSDAEIEVSEEIVKVLHGSGGSPANRNHFYLKYLRASVCQGRKTLR
jgi:hypothetical protein